MEKKPNVYKKLRESTETDKKRALNQSELAAEFEKEGNPLTQSVISKLETSTKEPPTKSFEVIKAYSEHFKVTSDYLLGLRDIPVVDENIVMMCNYLGLSDESIKRLHDYDDEYKVLLDRMIKSNDDMLKYILVSIYTYLFSKGSTVTIKNSLFNIVSTLEKEESQEILKYNATQAFEIVLQLLNRIYEKDIDRMRENNIEILETEIELIKLQNNNKNNERKCSNEVT